MPSLRASAAALVALAVLMTGISPAAAHRLKVFATAIGDRVEGRVYFVGGGPAVDVPVTLLAGEDAVVAQTRSGGPEGRFVLALPPGGPFVVRADSQDGHVAEFALRPTSAAAAPPAGRVATGQGEEPAAAASPGADGGAALAALVEEAVARQVAPLAEQIDDLRDSLRLRDILGGAGLIFGAFGLWAFVASRRRP